jgi:formylglycine-generating enzyme required for sulfatase activity
MDDLGIPPKDPQREGSHRDHSHRIVPQGDYWRGDLLRTMLFFEINHRDFISFALERGYDYEPVASIEEPLIPPSNYHSNKELVEERINDSPSVIRPVSERFWVPRIYLVDRFSPEMDLGVHGLDKTQSSDVAVISSEHVQQPQVKYLAAWPELRNRLDPLLGFPKRTRRLDAEALIKRISRGDPIRQIPFYQRKRLHDQITVIKEHALHCAPYRLDQEMVVEHLSQATVRRGLQVLDAFFPYGLSNPAFDDSSLVIRQQEMEPTPGSHILILGDLGLLLKIKDAFDQDAVEWWYRACRRWSSRGCKVFALVPFGCERVPARLRAWIEPIAWQGDAVRSLTHTQQEQGVTRLLTMAYPAQQIEPGLLRELRRLIPGLEDASLEARFWQDGRHGGPRYDAVKQTQASMRCVYKTQFEELDDSTITDILRRIRQYRIARGFSILWQMELMNLPKRLRDLIDPNSKEQELAIQTYQALCFQMLQGGTSGLQDRLMSLSIHASEHAIEDANIGSAVRTIKNRCLPDAKRSDKTRLPEVPPSIEMRKVQIECKPTGIRFLEVSQTPMNSIAIGPSNCVTMTNGKPVLELYVPGGSMDQQIRSFWKSGKKPEWVSDFGIDQYGAWCEFQVPRHGSKGVVTQRMRWIKPGQFMMGSPDTEQGRKSNESPQHQVTLTQGFWMADSQVTQELWRAISGGKNPSFYRNALSPVDGVNWDDCQIWIRQLRKHHESLKIALPTEAQWEYACRAGSTTAYCFGDDPEELPKYGWFAGNPGLLTSSVKHLLPNDWGLYDMHGNVWEWCSDWYDYYKKVPSLDPSGPSKGTDRVVRGGDWGSPFRRLRSACRVGYDPSYRDFHMGFRIACSAQGAEPSEGAMLGEFLSQRGQPRDGGKAQEKYQRSLEIHERLLEQNLQSAEAVRDVAVGLNNVGDFLSRRGQAYLQRNVVYIVYARRNEVEVEAVSEILESFGAEVLYDGKFSTDPGTPWTRIRDDFIENSRELLILTTPDIFTDPANPECLTLRDQIQVEVALAKSLGKPIRAIILDRPAFNRLLEAGIIASSDEQMTDLYPEYAISTKGLASPLAREKLRMRAIPGMRQYVLDLIAESRKWADQRLVGLERNLLAESTLSEWGHLKEQHGKDAAGLYLITGPGGAGKTVLVCREFFRDSIHAIHVPMSHLKHGLSSLAEFLQAEPDSIDETIQLWGELWGIHPIFYIDALDHTFSASKNDRPDSNSPSDDPASQYVPVIEAIRKLATAAPVIATARPYILSSMIKFLHPDRVVDITGRAASDSLEVREWLLGQNPQSAEAARDVSASLNNVPEAERSTRRARVGSAAVEYGFLRSIDLDATVEISPEKKFSEIDLNAYTSVRVVSDQESYQFDRLEKPIWAVEFGCDSYGLHASFEVSTVRQRMRWIPPGRFLMGSPDGKNYGRRNEYPQHEVILTHGYWMFDTPCRQRLWSALMEKNSSYFVHEDRPVETIRWEEAVAFAKKLSERLAEGFPTSGRNLFDGWNRLQFRLPTEAEWEYACRAGTTGDTYAGNLEIQGDANAPLLDAIAWYGGNSGHEYDLDKSVSLERAWLRQRQFHNAAGGTRNVGTKAPNPWGLYDMLGNVWEWCNDWYADDIASLEPVNPQGPTNGDRRVFRGGSWNSPARYLRSAYRHNHSILPMMSSHGFRLVFTPMADYDGEG